MHWNLTDLAALQHQIHHALAAAPTNPSDPLRTAAFVTSSDRGAPAQPTARTVVLRRADADLRQLIFHTDARSPKLREIENHSAVAWLFHDPAAQIQIRAEGTARRAPTDELVRAAWDATPLANRSNYCTPLPPGAPLTDPAAARPAAWQHREPTLAETEIGWPNFAVLITTITRLEWLRLHPQGARRARFDWTGTAWTAHWLVP